MASAASIINAAGASTFPSLAIRLDDGPFLLSPAILLGNKCQRPFTGDRDSTVRLSRFTASAKKQIRPLPVPRMYSGGGDETRKGKSIIKTFFPRKKKSSRPPSVVTTTTITSITTPTSSPVTQNTPPAPSPVIHPSAHTTPSPTPLIHPSSHTPPAPSPPLYPSAGAHSSPFPPPSYPGGASYYHSGYVVPGYYPLQYHYGEPSSYHGHHYGSSQNPPQNPPHLHTQTTVESTPTEHRQYIEPDSDTFFPSKDIIHKITSIIRSKFDAPYLSWKKIPLTVRDIWFGEFEDLPHQNLFTRLLSYSSFYHELKKIESVIAAIIILVQVSFSLPSWTWDAWFVSPANAVLYSPVTKVPRTGELALRRAIPAHSNMKAIQDSLEDIAYLLRIPQRKPYGTMEGDVKKALKIALEQKGSIIGSIPEEFQEKGSMLYDSLIDGKGGLQNLIESIKENDPDKVSVGLSSSLDTVAELELLQAPGLSFLLPEQYLKYPRLTGRGVVEFDIEKADGSTFFPSAGGEPKSFAKIQVVLDGYSAPLTAGNFAKLVIDGAYDGVMLKCTNQAVLSDNELENYGYSVPLEVKPSGEFEPLYKTALSIQDGELPVLPLSVFGAVAMAHSADSEEYSSPSQFFFYLYDKRNSGLGGLSFDEGHFSVFGYTTAGRDVLGQIRSGDLIRSAKLVQGQDRLVLPEEK